MTGIAALSRIVVTFEGREDGGLRAYSEDIPGFVISGFDADAVMSDLIPALQGYISHTRGAAVTVQPLPRLRQHGGAPVMPGPSARIDQDYVVCAGAGAP